MPTRFRATCAALLAVSAVAVFGVTHAAASAPAPAPTAATVKKYDCNSLTSYKSPSSADAIANPVTTSASDITIADFVTADANTVTLKKNDPHVCTFTLLAVTIDFASLSTTGGKTTAKIDTAAFTAASLELAAGATTGAAITVSITGTTFTALSTDNVKKTFIKFSGTFPVDSTFTITGNTFDLTAAGAATADLSIYSLNFAATFNTGLAVSVSGNSFKTTVTSTSSIASATTNIHHIGIKLGDDLDQATLDFKKNTYVIELNGMTRGGSPTTTSIAPININTDGNTVTNSEITLFGGGDKVTVSIYGATTATELGATGTVRVAGLAIIDGSLGTATNVLVAGSGVDASMFVASGTAFTGFTTTSGSATDAFFGMFGLLGDISGTLTLATGESGKPVVSRISCDGSSCGKRDTSQVFATITNAVTTMPKVSATYLTHVVLNGDTSSTGSSDDTDLVVLKTTKAVTLPGVDKTALDFSYVKAIASTVKIATTTTAMPALTDLTAALPDDTKKPALKLWLAAKAPTGKATLHVCSCQFQKEDVTDQKTLIDTAITDITGVTFDSCKASTGGGGGGGGGEDGGTTPKATTTKATGDGSGVTASGVHLGLIVGLCVAALVVG